jgi:hypothetical protein
LFREWEINMSFYRTTPWALLLAGTPLVIAAGLSACNEERSPVGEPAQLTVESVIQFRAVAPGQADQRLVELRNSGTGTLRITEATISPANSPFGAHREDDVNAWLAPLTIPPEESVYALFTYAPAEASENQVSAWMDVFSNGGPEDGGPTRIRLEAQAAAAVLDVSPNPIVFGRVPRQAEATQGVRLINRANFDIVLEEIFPVDVANEFTLLQEDLERLPIPLAANGGETLVTLRYRPNVDSIDEADLRVRYSSVAGTPGTVNVPIQANGSAPCLAVTHEDGYSFGQRLFNQDHEALFTITNCADLSRGELLEVTSISLLNEPGRQSSDAYTLRDVPTLPLVLNPGDTSSFLVNFRPTVAGRVESAWLQVRSNDRPKDPLVMEISGSGSDNACPTAVARCRVRGSSAPPSDEVRPQPLDHLDCSASGSNDPDGTIVRYSWGVISRPDGSGARFENASAAESSIFIDIAGAYELELNLFDNGGAPACRPARVLVFAEPDQDLHLQLVWDSPGVPDQTRECAGCGTDMDLHFLNLALGCWTRSPADLHWRNRSPDWGRPGDTTDNCSLDRDDVSSIGPENINCDEVAAGTYRLGVNYFSDHRFGPSTATVRIYLFGSLVFERAKLLTDKQFWDVVGLAWPSAATTVRDAVYANINEAPCP